MSGTLFPPEMYSEVLGVPSENSSCRIYSSDFPIANRPVLIANDVTSKFSERETSMSLIGEHVRAVIENTKGNVAIFAPSYSMLERVHSYFENLGWSSGKRIIKEEQRMSKKRVEGMIRPFTSRRTWEELPSSEYLTESFRKALITRTIFLMLWFA